MQESYIVYKTTNLINDKFYVGMHKTLDSTEFDGYYGSGSVFKKALIKYGKENFVREILFEFDTLEEARLKELEIVSSDFCKEKTNYNISVGGTGGNCIAGYTEEERKLYLENLVIASKISRNKRCEIYGGGVFSPETIEKMSESALTRVFKCPDSLPENKDRVHTKKARDNFNAAGLIRRGKYIHITDGLTTKVQPIESVIPFGWKRGAGVDRFRLSEHSEEAKQKIGNNPNIKGIKKYTNGIDNINVKLGDAIPDGFYPGLFSIKHKRRWITDGVLSLSVKIDDPLPEGFKLGRTFNRKNR